jgi:hypothetical protein
VQIHTQLHQRFWEFGNCGQFFCSQRSHQVLKIVNCRNKVKVSILISEIHPCRNLVSDFGSRMKGNVVSELLKLLNFNKIVSGGNVFIKTS